MSTTEVSYEDKELCEVYKGEITTFLLRYFRYIPHYLITEQMWEDAESNLFKLIKEEREEG
jgi:hypothetical protein